MRCVRICTRLPWAGPDDHVEPRRSDVKRAQLSLSFLSSLGAPSSITICLLRCTLYHKRPSAGQSHDAPCRFALHRLLSPSCDIRPRGSLLHIQVTQWSRLYRLQSLKNLPCRLRGRWKTNLVSRTTTGCSTDPVRNTLPICPFPMARIGSGASII